MADIELVIKLSEEEYKTILLTGKASFRTVNAIEAGIPLPKGHGKLIDAEKINDAIYERFEGIQFYEGTGYDVYSDLKESIENSPTIIEADKRDEG